MKKTLLFILAICFATLSFADNKRFDTMVVFGDSISDNGNLYRYMWYQFPASPPYYQGRFSNGPVWIERLISSYSQLQNNPEALQDFAVAGAGAVLSYKQALPYTLFIEINNYLYWHTYGKKDTTLFTIWIGANNYLNAPSNVESITTSVVDAIGSGVERLIGQGGTKFLLINLPDLGLSPYAIEGKKEALVTDLVIKHNNKLAAKYEELKQLHPELTFIYFDIYSYFKQALDPSTDFGFINIKDSCYFGGYLGWLMKPNDEQLKSYLKQNIPQFDDHYWQMIANNPQLKEAAAATYLYTLLPEANKTDALDCDGHVFWDRIHPTAKLHQIIADRARQVLDDAGLVAFSD
jgi:phospholipase/lecithinase/hemolysin